MPLAQFKKKNRLISKGMCVLLLDVFNRFFLVQQKNWRFQNFDFGKKIWRNAIDLKSKKGKRLFWHYRFRLSQISFNLFCSGDKRLLSDFFRKWGWFHKHNEQFPQISWLETETRFCRWKSNDYNNINIFLSVENPCTFLPGI